jgi:SAM-dependent methyltransferase
MSMRTEPELDYNRYFLDIVSSYSGKDKRFLDLGTGNGKVIFEGRMAGKFGHVTGIDTDEAKIRECLAKPGFSNLEFMVRDSRKTGFKDASFDVVTSMFSPFSLAEVERLLKKGGVFIPIFAMEGDHKEAEKAIPEHFRDDDYRSLKPLVGKELFPFFGNSRPIGAKTEALLKLTLEYTWIFPRAGDAAEFYSKILEKDIPAGKFSPISEENGEVRISRRMGILVLRKP